MSEKGSKSEGPPRELREVLHKGVPPDFGESQVREGYKPPKPANLGQPDVIPIPPLPPQNSQTGKQPENSGNEKK